jgi:hypothetical protein
MMQENEFMNESSQIALIEESQTVISHDENGDNPIVAVRIQTDTRVVNYRLYMDASTIHEKTGLSKPEVREHLADAPQDKILILDNKTFVRIPTVIRWNLASLQSSEPNARTLGQAFHSSAHSLFTEPGAMKARAISAASVTKKSNQAKANKRKELRKTDQDKLCQLSQQPINNQATQIHHRERIADKPELAAESSNLLLTLVPPHQAEHKDDKTLPTPSNLDIKR